MSHSTPPPVAMALVKSCADVRAGTLREFHVFRASTGKDGAQKLATALAQNESLTTLNLQVRMEEQ